MKNKLHELAKRKGIHKLSYRGLGIHLIFLSFFIIFAIASTCIIIFKTSAEDYGYEILTNTFINRMSNWIIIIAFVYFIIFVLISIKMTSSTHRTEEQEKSMIQHQKDRKILREVIEAFATVIDIKDPYTEGHSKRVADYSVKIAKKIGMDDEDCEKIYFAGLLHDIGKLGVDTDIINKKGKLTDEEFAIIKQHPVVGAEILKNIKEYPYLVVGALYHHERYDGKGYPHGLKGSDIPDMARIIAIADAYDAMSSKRSYRDPIPQQKIREEFVKGSGTQFDPIFAKYMLQIIDIDTEYEMRERLAIYDDERKDDIFVREHKSLVSDGILLTSKKTTIKLKINGVDKQHLPIPALLLFDSLDGRYHSREKEAKDLLYVEYGEVWFDGFTEAKEIRKNLTEIKPAMPNLGLRHNEYIIEAVRYKDHVLIKIFGTKQTAKVTLAMRDASRYVYIGLTGVNCWINNVRIENSEQPIDDNYITRIAEEISYIDEPAGDIPNVQVDGYRTASTDGIEIMDGMLIKMHAKSLPTARLVWHCPFISLFTSDDKKPNGENYREFLFLRFDGECWDTDPNCKIEVAVNKTTDFAGWDAWKKFNKDGYDTMIRFWKFKDKIVISTENAGITMKITAEISNDDKPIYAAITGDQVAITDIRIK